MVTIQQCTLHKKIAYGVEQAKSLSRSILVSISTKVDLKIDPITFYYNGKTRTGERLYWSAPSGDFVMVGVGHAYRLESNQGNDFRRFEREWQELNDFSVIEPQERLSGVGPVLAGSFSFDPEKEKTELWSEFPVARMVLPTHLLSIVKDEVWLTINAIVNKDTNVERMADALLQEQDNLVKEAEAVYVGTGGQKLYTEEVVKNEWIKAVDTVAKQIREHEIEKVVLARQIRVSSSIAPFRTEDILDRLRKEQPSSYIFAVESGANCFIGASPERLVKKEGKKAFTTCLAGSIDRGESFADDERLGEELLQDEKNLHEHEVVVRAITTAFEQGCDSVEVPEKPILYKVRDIQHLYTPVVGEVKEGVSLLTLVEKLHPTPALGGYPREQALAKIRELEQMDRGLYAGPVGWIDSNGNGEFAVAIRSGLLQENEASLFAGCGIVGDSDPMSEYKETEMKLRPMLSALGGLCNDRE